MVVDDVLLKLTGRANKHALSHRCERRGAVGQYLKACSTGTRMSKMVLNQAFALDYEDILDYYLELQERTQYSLDGEEGKRAYLDKRDPVWQ